MEQRGDLWLAEIDGLERKVNYRPIEYNKPDTLNISFSINQSDTLFVFAVNNKEYQDKLTNFIGKMAVVNYNPQIFISDLSNTMSHLNVDKFIIFSINLSDVVNTNIYTYNEQSNVKYIEINLLDFIYFVNSEKFLRYNPFCLYILRDGTYRDMKYILSHVGKQGVNLGRGGGQKSHILSPLDLRLSCYLMALGLMNYKETFSCNTFNKLSKKRYLPQIEIKK